MTIKEIFRRTNLKKICAILIFPIPQPQVESGARRRSEGGNVVERRETERDPFSRVVENFFHFFRPRSRKISARFFEALASWLKFEGIKQAWHEGREKARWWWIRWLPKYRFVSNIFCPGRALKFVEAIKIKKLRWWLNFFRVFVDAQSHQKLVMFSKYCDELMIITLNRESSAVNLVIAKFKIKFCETIISFHRPYSVAVRTFSLNLISATSKNPSDF